MGKKVTTNKKKTEKVYNVRVVEDKTKPSITKVHVITVLILMLGMYLFFDGKSLIEALNSEEISFIDTFKETLKELIYSTSFSFVIIVANALAFKSKKE